MIDEVVEVHGGAFRGVDGSRLDGSDGKAFGDDGDRGVDAGMVVGGADGLFVSFGDVIADGLGVSGGLEGGKGEQEQEVAHGCRSLWAVR